MKTFPQTAYWCKLDTDEKATDEPVNTIRNARAPTIGERDAKFIPVKYGFSKYSFDIPEFDATDDRELRWANGRVKKTKDGTNMKDSQKRVTGRINPEFIKKHNLNRQTRPDQYAETLLPLNRNIIDNKEWVSFCQWKDWSNLKASLADAGKDGSCYRDFVDYTTPEIRQHVGIYLLNGLCTSPSVEKKFKPQHVDKIHGNDFVYRSFGANAERRHRHFKAFFACQDPRITPPNRDKEPNWKVRPLLTWMNYIFPSLWLLACAFSVDEMTMGFKGHHKDKLRITYKNEGDGFQSDALCQDGFTYQIWMCNDRAPSRYLKKGLSPLHARVMGLFDSLKEDHHQCAMDNLYNSAAFCKHAYNHKKKVLCHGVTRSGMRGIPNHVKQAEVKNRKDQIAVRGTVKAAVLEGDPTCPNLVASSVYDAKPVHYLSMVSKEVKWCEIKKNVYNVDSGEVEVLRFLRLQHIDKYNQEMGNVDLADQLRGSYWLDKSIRNRKWWWAIMFWSIGVILTNAYIMYLKINMLEHGLEKNDLMSHHDFRMAIALYWINPQEYLKDLATSEPYTLSRKSSSTSTVSSISIDSSLPVTHRNRKVKTGGHHVTDASLCPSTGTLRCRLNRNLDHKPASAGKRARCRLHWWGGIETQSKIIACPTCSVSLCSKCYSLFHQEADLVGMKDRLKKRFKR